MGNIIAGSVTAAAMADSAKGSATPSAKRLWTGLKLFTAVRDLPEVRIGSSWCIQQGDCKGRGTLAQVLPLAFLLSVVSGLALYTAGREYLTLASEQFPSKEMRHDMTKQISYGQEHVKPHILQYVAKWKRERDEGLDVGVWPFSNRSFRMEHEIPLHRRQALGVPAEGPYPTEY